MSAPTIFDTALIGHRLRRAAEKPNFVYDLVVEDLHERLQTLLRPFTRAAVIVPDGLTPPQGSHTGQGPVRFIPFAGFAGTDEVPDLGDEPFDLIVSLLHLQAVNDVPGYLTRLRRHLKPDGLLLLAALGGDTLSELREAFLSADAQVLGGAAGRVAPMIQVRDAGTLLQRAGLALPVADVETHVVRYGTPFALMAELKTLGAANPLADRPRRFASPTLLTAAANAYQAQDSDPDGRIRATLEIVWLSGWAPHDSQQQPLKPGSATVNLRDVLGAGRSG